MHSKPHIILGTGRVIILYGIMTLKRTVVLNVPLYYKEQFANLANDRWHPADFYQLEYDPGLDLIYSNTGFETWIINV